MARTKQFNAATRKSLIKLESGLAKLTNKIESILILMDEEEREMKGISEKRVKAAHAKMLRKMREMKEERKLLKPLSRTGGGFHEPGKRTRKNGWTEEQLRIMKEGLASGRTVQEVADELGKKIAGVRQKAFQVGIRLREIRKALPKPVSAIRGTRGRRRKEIEIKPWTPEELREILGLLASGMPLKDVSLKTGRSFNAIRTKLQLEGVPLEDIREGTIPPDALLEDDGRSGIERFMEAIGDDSMKTDSIEYREPKFS
jgi:hypothetical protein